MAKRPRRWRARAGDEWVDWVGMSVYSLGPYNPYGQNTVGYNGEFTMKARHGRPTSAAAGCSLQLRERGSTSVIRALPNLWLAWHATGFMAPGRLHCGHALAATINTCAASCGSLVRAPALRKGRPWAPGEPEAQGRACAQSVCQP